MRNYCVCDHTTSPSTKEDLSLFKLLYHAEDVHASVKDVQFFVSSGYIEMIHAFLKPCSSKCWAKIVGDDTFSSTSTQFQSAIKLGDSTGDLAFFLELGCYMWDTPDNVIEELISSSSKCIGGEMSNDVDDFQTYIMKDPPVSCVIETNKAHGTVPHPSFATMIDENHDHIHSNNRGNDDVNEILIMPVKSNSTLNKGHNVPMFPLPNDSNLSLFLLLLGSVLQSEGDSSETIMDSIRAHHRSLYHLSNALGDKRYSYYDTITSEVSGENAWSDYYGEDAWECLRAAKRKYDPRHIFAQESRCGSSEITHPTLSASFCVKAKSMFYFAITQPSI